MSSTRRGQRLSRLTLFLAPVAAVLLGVSIFGAMNSVDLASVYPFATTGLWLIAGAAAGTLGILLVLLGTVLLLWSRPRRIAGLALAVAVVMPMLTVAVSALIGIEAIKANATQSLRADNALVLHGLDALASWDIDVSSVRELLPRPGG